MERKLQICLLSYRGNPYCGGQGIYLFYLARSLAERGHRVTVLAGPPYPWPMPFARLIPIPDHNFINKPGASAIPVDNPLAVFKPLELAELGLSRLGVNPEMLVFSLRAYSLLKNLMARGERFDIVHDNQSLGYGLLLIRRLGIPVVATIHHPLQVDRKEDLKQMPELARQFKRALYYPLFMQKLVARRLDHLVTVSRVSKNLISDWYKIAAEKIAQIPNGVDLEFFRPKPEIEKIPGRIVFVGSSEDRKKGILHLLRSLKRLAPPAHLAIVDGRLNPQRVYARNLVHELGLESRVSFLEKISREQLIIEYNKAQVAVMPSLFEGFGLPALEAMACGTALLATRAGGLAEVVGEGEEAGGMLVEPGDEQALADALSRLLGDEALRRKLEERGRKRAQSGFGWEKVAERLELLYNQVLEQRRDEHGGQS